MTVPRRGRQADIRSVTGLAFWESWSLQSVRARTVFSLFQFQFFFFFLVSFGIIDGGLDVKSRSKRIMVLTGHHSEVDLEICEKEGGLDIERELVVGGYLQAVD